jgi:hypothetical protein
VADLVATGAELAVADLNHPELVRRAARSGVSRFVLASVPVTDLDERVPVARTKRRTEQLLAESGLSWPSLRTEPSARSGWPSSEASYRCAANSGPPWGGPTRHSAGSGGSPVARSSDTA